MESNQKKTVRKIKKAAPAGNLAAKKAQTPAQRLNAVLYAKQGNELEQIAEALYGS